MIHLYIRPDFRCTEIVKYSVSKIWPIKRDDLIRWGDLLMGDNLVVFYYLSAS
jgi:hypothetical protein